MGSCLIIFAFIKIITMKVNFKKTSGQQTGLHSLRNEISDREREMPTALDKICRGMLILWPVATNRLNECMR